MKGQGRQLGFVAVAAVCMLAVVAGVAAATFRTVAEVRRAANRAARQEEAASAADRGLHAALEAWDVAARESLAVGAVTLVSVPPVGDSTRRSRVGVARLGPAIYWITSTGRAASGTTVEAVKSHNLLVETLVPSFPPGAALVAGGDVIASAGMRILGDDSTPPGWDDCPPEGTGSAPAIVVGDDRSARFNDGRPIPNVHVDTNAVAIAKSNAFGRVTIEALGARRTIAIAPGAILSPQPDTGGDCQLGRSGATPTDWGDPRRTGAAPGCKTFYPVLAADGDLTVRNGIGQGVLLVAGRLRIEGPFAFHGVLVARGGLAVTGSGISIYGAAVSASDTLVSLAADGLIARSSCAVRRVASAAARAYPLPLRAWSELF